MYRLTEEIARKIIRNVRDPQIGPLDITQRDPFMPKNLNSIGFLDCYAAIGTEFRYVLEFPYSVINPSLPSIKGLDGYWLYRSKELLPPIESFSVPRYLADPNINNGDEMIEVGDISVVIPSDIEKLTCKSIMTFEQLITNCPDILDCLNSDIR